MRMLLKHIRFHMIFLLLLTVAIAPGCIGKQTLATSHNTQNGKGSVNLVFSASDKETSTLSLADVDITASDMAPIHQQFDISGFAAGEPITFSLEVPAGKNRLFSVSLWTSDEVMAYKGKTTADVKTDQDTAVSISVDPYGRIDGKIYTVGTSMYPGDPLANYSETKFEPPITTDDQGLFSVVLPVRTTAYKIEVSPSEGMDAFVPVVLESPAQVEYRELYVVPTDGSLPMTCAVAPISGTEGDEVFLYGYGYSMPSASTNVYFQPGSGGEAYGLQNVVLSPDSTYIRATLPAITPGVGYLYVEYYVQEPKAGNLVKFTVY